ncbi:hypothetical protein NX779_03495 [Mycoplasma cottewii]|uniref:Uncharacterized protein n=1 Tax=Mycoplasma cottewii TaxID=51364 RepID=A0ABY5U0X2_9MOLU|nr:hypothetical protein [Mycoplasma cottewii]UWD35451.1 hypothetical protein NX779_03495 [Mycoplasma cottewii]
MKSIPIRICITNKTYNQLKNNDFNFDLITEKSIDYFVISNNKNIFYDKDNFYMLTKKNNKISFDFIFLVLEFNEKFCSFIGDVYRRSMKELNEIFFSKSNSLYFQMKFVKWDKFNYI